MVVYPENRYTENGICLKNQLLLFFITVLRNTEDE
jgi:hypothetical protein